MRDDVLYIHMKEPCVTVLGPGKRFVVWTQGCDRHCPGCTAPEAQDMHSGEEISVDALATEILDPIHLLSRMLSVLGHRTGTF